MDITIIVFLLVYLALAFGYLPGFNIDRTGAAVLAGMLLVGLRKISPEAAWAAIDFQTIGLLFGLMVISGAFVLSGFYSWAAVRVASLQVASPVLLALLIGVGAVLSAVLTNDVVVVAMTPLLVSITLSRGLNPVPFLLGFCFATNTGATATLIGSPQNIIAAQALDLSFAGFMRVTFVPALVSLPLVWAVIAVLYRGKWLLPAAPASVGIATQPVVNMTETIKAAVVISAVVLAFIFSDWPREVVAMLGAALILINRRGSKLSSQQMIGTVDGNLLLLLAGLFVVNAALAQTGLPEKVIHDLQAIGVDLGSPMVLFLVASGLSNTVGNNPAVMLLVPFLPKDGESMALGASLALGTGFSSNMIVFGSLAGIIVVEQAARHGVTISMREFCRAGIPVTILCMILAVVWIAWLT